MRILCTATFPAGLAARGLTAWLLALALGAPGGAAEEPGPCQAEARLRCGGLEDAEARARCVVEREMECERRGPRRDLPDRPPAFRGACRADFERLCAELGPEASRSRILRCLEEHAEALSPPCRQALE